MTLSTYNVYVNVTVFTGWLQAKPGDEYTIQIARNTIGMSSLHSITSPKVSYSLKALQRFTVL